MKLDNILHQIQSGDKKAFETLYNDTKSAVYYTALSILRQKQLAEDVMQSTYLNILKNISSYQVGTNARAWILKIAKNLALNAKKTADRESPVDETQNVALFGSYDLDEYGHTVDLARKYLNDDEFNILMLIAVSKYKRKEIAEYLNIPISTVTWKYNEAIKKMKKLLMNKQGV